MPQSMACSRPAVPTLQAEVARKATDGLDRIHNDCNAEEVVMRNFCSLTVKNWAVRAMLASIWIVLASACAPRMPLQPPQPPVSAPAAQLRVDPNAQWTNSGLRVRVGDRLIFWATGEISNGARPNQPIGPDGIDPSRLNVGRGGLVGRIGEGKPFDVGARTHIVRWRTRHTRGEVVPPPIVVKEDGELFLGIKRSGADRFAGAFTVSVWRNP